MRYLALMIGLLVFATVLRADDTDFAVKITPSVSQISIKDILEVSLDLTFPEGYHVDMETLRQNVLRSSSFYEHPFAIADMKIDNPQKNADGTYSQHILIALQPLRLGNVPLTFYDISFVPQDKKNKMHKLISNIFPIDILSIEAPLQFHGRLAPLLTFSKTFPLGLNEQNQNSLIEDPQVQKRQEQANVIQMNKKRLPWVEIGCVLLIILVFWIFLKHPHVKPPLTAEQLAQAAKAAALADLEQLKAKNLPEKEFFDEFYVELTNPVRAYIEKRYHVAAPTSTTSEFLAETARNPAFPIQTRQQLGQFLSEADKVKFGRYHPSVEECDHAQKLAVNFIKSE